jgi:hypothetical protein
MRHKNDIPLLTCLFSLAAVHGFTHTALAQEAAPSHELLRGLYACQKLEAIEDQNTCYDQAVLALKTAEQDGDVLIINKQNFIRMQEGVFGYNNIPIEKLSPLNADQVQTITSISVPVKKVERYLSGYVVSLDNNQVWEQFAGSIPRVPKGKLIARINMTPTGSYKMVLFNDRSRVSNIRVRRIQ